PERAHMDTAARRTCCGPTLHSLAHTLDPAPAVERSWKTEHTGAPGVPSGGYPVRYFRVLSRSDAAGNAIAPPSATISSAPVAGARWSSMVQCTRKCGTDQVRYITRAVRTAHRPPWTVAAPRTTALASVMAP